MIKISWRTLSILTEKTKTMELPDHAYDIRAEFGGFYSSKDVYVWWKEYGNDKCKKIASTKWKSSFIYWLEKGGIKIEYPNTSTQAVK